MSITEELAERLSESLNDFVDPREPYYDTPGFGWLARKMGFYTRLDERLHGRYAPVYENELDLKAIRMASWIMDAQVPVAKAMKYRLRDYTIASGFDWTIVHESPRVEAVLQSAWQQFLDNCKWDSIESESFEREIVDGEFLAEIVSESGDTTLEILEGDNLTEPLFHRDLEEWLGFDFPTSWTFGVLTRENRATPLGYHVIRNTAATDWDYIPAKRFIHWKRNVTRNAKRGAPDHYTTHKWLNHGEKVLTRTALGAAIQASIAYIIEHASGVNRAQAAALANRRSDVEMKRDPFTGNYVKKRQIGPGQVIDVPQGQQYRAGMIGANNSSIYIEVMEACFRLSGTVYAFPEHMLTGFAGNNNRASSETAESPFIQGRYHDQRIRGMRLHQLILQVLRAVVESSPLFKASWEEIETGLEVTVAKPELVSRDVASLTEALIKQRERNWVSDRMAIQELGRDFEDVQSQLAEESGVNSEGDESVVGEGNPGDEGDGEQPIREDECEMEDLPLIEAEYKGRKVTLNQPFRLPSSESKKFGVYVKNDKGNVIRLRFGDPDMEIKRDDPEARKNFRSRHNCDNPGPKWKARYWSCYQWRAKAKVAESEREVLVLPEDECQLIEADDDCFERVTEGSCSVDLENLTRLQRKILQRWKNYP